jgi:cohesin loading factor subunit SCC2
MSQPNGGNHPDETRKTLRVPTVAEALPFSPFSSILPFTLGIVSLVSHGMHNS